LPQLVVADPLAQQLPRRSLVAISARFAAGWWEFQGVRGKTSTKDLLALLLGGSTSGVVATEGNSLHNHIGVPLTLTRIRPAAASGGGRWRGGHQRARRNGTVGGED
jgi:UDP-N-acetylmuramoyl-tripeptide--D-alanyl-D-alanine ligase